MLAIGVTKAQDAAAILAPVRVAMVAAFDSPSVPDGFEIRTDHGPQDTGEPAPISARTGRSTTPSPQLAGPPATPSLSASSGPSRRSVFGCETR